MSQNIKYVIVMERTVDTGIGEQLLVERHSEYDTPEEAFDYAELLAKTFPEESYRVEVERT